MSLDMQVGEDADFWRQQTHDVMAELHERESQLGAAHAEIARLTEALEQAARMFTITGARKIIAEALEGEVSERTSHRRRSRL